MGISIHAPHEGGRHKEVIKCVMQLYFNPRSPRGGATEEGRAALASYAFQSTLPTRGSDATFSNIEQQSAISIHAPHEGERRQHGRFKRAFPAISIHAPHEGERQNTA